MLKAQLMQKTWTKMFLHIEFGPLACPGKPGETKAWWPCQSSWIPPLDSARRGIQG